MVPRGWGDCGAWLWGAKPLSSGWEIWVVHFSGMQGGLRGILLSGCFCLGLFSMQTTSFMSPAWVSASLSCSHRARETNLSFSFIPLRTSALEDSSPSNVLWPSWGADAVLWVLLVRICGRWILPGAAPADREPAVVEVIYVYRHSGVVKMPQMLPLGLWWTELMKNIPTDWIWNWSKHPNQGLLLGSGLFYFIFGHKGCAPIS